MICKTCGGTLAAGSRVCAFCGTEILDSQDLIRERMEQLMGGQNDGQESAKSGCGGCESPGCGETGLTDSSKGAKYGFFLIGLVVVIVGGAIAVKSLFGI